MAFSVNVTTQSGTLTKDAVFSGGNNPRLNFSIAHNDGWGDNKTTDFYEVVLWGKRGENLAQYLPKGTNVIVTGKFSTRKYEYNGENRTSLQINATDVSLLPKANQVPVGVGASNDSIDDFGDDDNLNDEVPF